MFLTKSEDQILQQALDQIKTNTPYTNVYAGSIVRSLFEAISTLIGSNENNDAVYDMMEKIYDDNFLSTADSEALNLIAGMFNYKRRSVITVNSQTGEEEEQLIDDEMFRKEISEVVEASKSSNLTSIRFHLLQIQGVRDVVFDEFRLGTGSFVVIGVPMAGYDDEEIKEKMEEVLEEQRAFGVKTYVDTPHRVIVDMRLKLMFRSGVTPSEKDFVIYETINSVRNHFDRKDRGESFLYHEFAQFILDQDERIQDFEITSFSLDGRPVLRGNHHLHDNDQLKAGDIEIV